MTEIFIGDGQSPLGDLSGTSELAPPIFQPTPVPGTIDFQNTSGVGTQPGRLSLMGAGHQARAGAVRLVQQVNGADPYPTGSVITARRTRLGSFGTYTELPQSRTRSWTDPLVDVGSGDLFLKEDDAELANFDFDGNDVIQFSLNGQLAYAVVVEEPTRVQIATDEDAGQGWRLGGRGHLSVLERALVYPAMGVGISPAQEDRIWNWASRVYDDTTWQYAHVVNYVLWVTPTPYGAGGDWGGFEGAWDPAFGDPNAAILWSTAGSSLNAPDGRVYSRQWIRGVGAARKRLLQVEADNACDVYVNEQLVVSTTGWTQMSQVEVEIPVGDTLIAIVCENWFPSGPYNPAGWAWTLLEYGYPYIVLARSDASAKIMPYPASVPSIPVGKVIRLAVQEAQLRGAIPYITLAFTDTHDSAGRLWPTPEISTKVGTDLFTFFSKEIGETYADLYMPPGGTVLYAWNKYGRGTSSGLVLAGSPNDFTPGNLTALSHDLIP